MKRFLFGVPAFCVLVNSILPAPVAFGQDSAKELAEKARGRWDDGPVEQAIKKGIAWLYKNQHNDGSFGRPGPGHIEKHCWTVKPDSYKFKSPALRSRLKGVLKLKREPKPGSVGKTSVALYALLKCGEDIHDNRIQKGLRFIMTHDTFGIYTIGLRCNTWVTAEKYETGKYMRHLRHDAMRLIFSIHKDTGGWNYSIWEDAYHNSPSQYGILGVWGYQMLGGEIPSNFWPLALKYWIKGQRSDGGWSYQPSFKGGDKKSWGHQSSGSMSTAGLASMFVCMDALLAEKYIKCEGGDLPAPIVKGLKWFDKEFTNTMVGKTSPCHGRNFSYYLYGVERVGRACGYKYFGKQDWYKLGTLALLQRQVKNGSWGGWSSMKELNEQRKKRKRLNGNVSETGFSLLFLAKGRHPVMFNKLNFGGDWNNRPRDLSHLTRWMSRNYEQEFNWQNVNLHVPPHEWHDAPILYISGSGKPAFSEEDIKKLRTYVYQGGTIFSVAECNGKDFSDGIREIYKKAFPRYELVKAASENPLYSIHADLKGKPEVYLLSNGARPLVIHTDEDLAKTWQVGAHVTRKDHFLFGVNLTRYICGSYNDLLPRGKTYWPFPAKGAGGGVTVSRVKYAGNYDPEPLALTALQRKLAADEKTSLQVNTIAMEKLGGCGSKVAMLTGTGAVSLAGPQKNGLKAFVESGGRLVVDAAGGSKDFYNAMHKTLRDIFGASSIKAMSGGNPVFTRKKNPIKDVSYRPATRKRFGGKAIKLEGITVKGRRGAVILSREDLTTGLLGAPSGVVDGYAPDSAYNIVRNIIMTSK